MDSAARKLLALVLYITFGLPDPAAIWLFLLNNPHAFLVMKKLRKNLLGGAWSLNANNRFFTFILLFLKIGGPARYRPESPCVQSRSANFYHYRPKFGTPGWNRTTIQNRGSHPRAQIHWREYMSA